MKSLDRHEREAIGARIVDEIAAKHGLHIVPQAGSKCTLYATTEHQTIPVAEVSIFPRRVTPLTNRAIGRGPLRDLTLLGWV